LLRRWSDRPTHVGTWCPTRVNPPQADKMRSGMEAANKDSLTTVTVNTGISGDSLKQREARFSEEKKKRGVLLHFFASSG